MSARDLITHLAKRLTILGGNNRNTCKIENPSTDSDSQVLVNNFQDFNLWAEE